MSKQSQGQPSYRPADACAQGKHGWAAALQQTWLPGAVGFICARTVSQHVQKKKKNRGKINHAIYCLYAQCQKFDPELRQTHNKSVGGDNSPFPSGKHLFFSCATHRESRRLGARPGRVRCSASTLFTYQTDTVGQPRLFPSVTHVEEPRAQPDQTSSSRRRS